MSWIKVETHTPEKPEVDRAMVLCRCSRAVAFLAFFKFYAWADRTTEDGWVPFLTPAVADNRSGLRGFGRALADVGWVTYESNGGRISHWERHNGKSAKKRAMTAERVMKHRQAEEEQAEQSVKMQNETLAAK
jgi:hypothetical protein